MHARRNWFSFAAILSAAATLLLATSPVAGQTSGNASDAESARMAAILDGAEFTPAIKPHAADRNATTTVILKMAGDSVAEVEKKTHTKLDDAGRAQVRGDLKSRQDAIDGDIQANGGSVVAKYQDAYNGVKVDVPASKVAALGTLRNVVAVRSVALYQLENTQSVPFTEAPAAWAGAAGVAGVRGESIKVGIIDTGIDYTHANFGGPGTEAAFAAAYAAKQANQLPQDPASLGFGPGAAKVKGGIDLVGDAYNAATPPGDPRRIPHPGPNPLDCYGHGSHVAGTAAGFGVTGTGTTYTGEYNPSTYTSTSFKIGPGVAPKADLYAIRVFGCQGSTNVVVDAINWAVANRMDVINMSLGSSYGDPKDASVEAANNAAEAGMIVVASAGNSGSAPYITGSPAIAAHAISVAAADTIKAFPAYTVTLNAGGAPIVAVNANDSGKATLSGLKILVLPWTVKGYSGCDDAEYPADATGMLIVTLRGSCARVDRAILGARHHAAAVLMINSSTANPVYEGPIQDPVSKKIVDIPFLGIPGSDVDACCGPDGNRVVAAAAADLAAAPPITNNFYTGFAGFTSGGPGRANSLAKPDVTAPGVSIMSTLSGSGNEGERNSGTSMAAPHVAGVAALVRQAHPGWDQEEQRAAIVNTATSAANKVKAGTYKVSRGGAGEVSAVSAVRTQATATTDDDATALSFGFNELTGDYTATQTIRIVNHGSAPITFSASSGADTVSRTHTITFNASSVTVSAGDEAKLTVTLSVKASDVGSADAFREVAGAVTLTPGAAGMNNDVSLRVPYLMVPRARSSVATELSTGFGPNSPSGTATVTNTNGARSGVADFYAWGLQGSNAALGDLGIRAVGVHLDPAQVNPANNTMTFAVNTFGRFNTPDVTEYDILIDTTGTGTPNKVLVAIDLGKFAANSYNGAYFTFLCNLPNGDRCRRQARATAPFNGSTILAPVKLSDLALTGNPNPLDAAHPRFTYTAESFDLKGDRGYAGDSVSGPGTFNAFTPAISSGQVNYTVAPGATVTATVSINADEWDETPALGLMIVTLDNLSGGAQAQLVSVR